MAKRQSLSDKHPSLFFVMPAFVVMFAITIVPFIYTLYLSFHTWSVTRPQYGFVFSGLYNYIYLFLNDAEWWKSLANTIYITAVAISVETLVGLGIALLLAREFGGKGVVRTLLCMPMMTTPMVVGLTWYLMYQYRWGVVNHLLVLVGLPRVVWLVDPVITLHAIILVDIWQWSPFMILGLLAGISALPVEPIEAAQIDGASSWQQFRHVTLPMLRKFIAILVLLRSMDLFKMFDIVYTITEGGPGTATETLSFFTYKQAFDFFHTGYSSAIAVIIFIILIAIAQVFIRLVRPVGE